MTLGNAAAAHVRLIVWCKDCRHQIEPDPAEMAARYGAETPVPDWRERLVCSRCGGRQVDMVVSGASSASEMCPQPVTAAAYHVRADRPLLISRCANRGGTWWSPMPLNALPSTPVARELREGFPGALYHLTTRAQQLGVLPYAR
jgi:hypothetical protein